MGAPFVRRWFASWLCAAAWLGAGCSVVNQPAQPRFEIAGDGRCTSDVDCVLLRASFEGQPDARCLQAFGRCDVVAARCMVDVRTIDEDGDGFAPSACVGATFDGQPVAPLGCDIDVATCGARGADCDDRNAALYPAAPEICDGLVDDCNSPNAGQPLPFEDLDHDGFASPTASCSATTRFPKTDCDDYSFLAFPGANEICNDADDDCDGSIDDGVPTFSFFRDQDNDGYGDPRSVSTPVCRAPAGFVARGTDCAPADSARSACVPREHIAGMHTVRQANGLPREAMVSLGAADLDSDGDDDVVALLNTPNGLRLFWYETHVLGGTPSPTLYFEPHALDEFAIDAYNVEVVVDDLTGDGLPDILAAVTQGTAAQSGVLLYVHPGTGISTGLAWSKETLVGFGSAIPSTIVSDVDVGDLDGDGLRDVVVGVQSDFGGWRASALLQRRGPAGERVYARYDLPSPVPMRVGPAFTSYDWAGVGAEQIRVFLGSGYRSLLGFGGNNRDAAHYAVSWNPLTAGSFSASPPTSLGFGTIDTPGIEAVTEVDVNGDGIPETLALVCSFQIDVDCLGTQDILLVMGDGTQVRRTAPAPQSGASPRRLPRFVAVNDTTATGLDVIQADSLGVGRVFRISEVGQMSVSSVSVNATDTGSGYVRGDFDGDGRRDLFRMGDDHLSFYRGTATGIASADPTLTQTNYSTGPAAHVTHDVDGDGDEDIVYLKIYPDVGLSWLENVALDGSAVGVGRRYVPRVLLDATLFPTDLYPLDLESGDVDGDGDTDFVIRTQTNVDSRSGLVWVENVGPGVAFTGHCLVGSCVGEPEVCPTGSACEMLLGRMDDPRLLADLDGDSQMDLIVTSKVTNTIWWFEWQLGGSFRAQQLVSGANTLGAVEVADVTGDGAADVIYGRSDGVALKVLRSPGLASLATDPATPFTEIASIAGTCPIAGRCISSIRGGDFDGDGDADFVVSGADDAIRMFRNVDVGGFGGGNGTQWQRIAVNGAVNLAQLEVADVDGDGALDVVGSGPTGATLATPQAYSLFQRPAGSGLNALFAEPLPVLFGFRTSAVTVGDPDGDGDLDYVVGVVFGDGILWMENRGGPFEGYP